ncbi:uncharacterized protein LACBIDRAFT_301124 [Laccaria bicolor S238N-H82]|uniref:aminodeoxychorismate synthase n=1 Tax=Laccaria bicolor (strain S238N-H82 / ATCC MYA-4686) TaxID=486041 RepID=B0CRD9_LACBS|nr:uncharacterized protein LACBIDRAFT_301124 [Laccaria bicolor S238N-H82]EDR15802.1 predicted protein [Laccaria bicolor S238N-H82]|eukprot:XP_001874010.1 predicted protein [Laccaria bicolor S238N-H82]
MSMTGHNILLIDSYDSFTHNLAALCHQSISNSTIFIIKNDEYTLHELRPFLKYFSVIVVGPGPGSPDVSQDIGVVKDLWKLDEEDLLPIFGVCLGLQSLSIEFGATLKRLRVVKHGQMSHVNHVGMDLFTEVRPFQAVRYHSLHVDLAEDGEVKELAWADDEENGRVVMAVRHNTRPFWAVQYHPESVCTEGGGIEVVRNFWRLAQTWAKETGRQVHPCDDALHCCIGTPWPYTNPHSPAPTPSQLPTVLTSKLELSDLSVIDICEEFGAFDESSRFALLDSASNPGRFAIIACLEPTSLQITHMVGEPVVQLKRGENCTSEELGHHDIWSWLASFMRFRKANGGVNTIPFWGGLVGYMSYELGVHSIRVPIHRSASETQTRHPDVNLVFVERSIVLDTHDKKIFVQSLIPKDEEWIEDVCAQLSRIPRRNENTSSVPSIPSPVITIPDRARYVSRIHQAKEHLYAGDSYELCLTAQTRILIPQSSSPSPTKSTSWERYKGLRRANPAPHSAYLRLHPSTLLSSSPERFLSFSRPPGSICQLRPIKGTVRKSSGITRAIAEQALVGSPKEVAENLMIVDLIRHDLHGVLGDDVTVKQFCGVEEYETVWQLVSVIEGKLTEENSSNDEVGWQVLKRSLPPGSMTGAPKKRSVEILQTLEDQERGIYSGVFGYFCVSGGGDWSVTIRSCFKYDDISTKRQSVDSEEWIVGAGGAITALSDAEAEWDEMIVKLESVLRAFGALS